MSNFKIVSVAVSNGQFTIKLNSPLSNSNAVISVLSNASYVTNNTPWKYCGAASPLGALDQSHSTYGTMCCSDSDGCTLGAIIQSVSLNNGSPGTSSGVINWVNEIQFGLY